MTKNRTEYVIELRNAQGQPWGPFDEASSLRSARKVARTMAGARFRGGSSRVVGPTGDILAMFVNSDGNVVEVTP